MIKFLVIISLLIITSCAQDKATTTNKARWTSEAFKPLINEIYNEHINAKKPTKSNICHWVIEFQQNLNHKINTEYDSHSNHELMVYAEVPNGAQIKTTTATTTTSSTTCEILKEGFPLHVSNAFNRTMACMKQAYWVAHRPAGLRSGSRVPIERPEIKLYVEYWY